MESLLDESFDEESEVVSQEDSEQLQQVNDWSRPMSLDDFLQHNRVLTNVS